MMYIDMFKNRIVDIITSIALLVGALIVVDLSVLDFNLGTPTTYVFQAVTIIISAVISVIITMRQ